MKCLGTIKQKRKKRFKTFLARGDGFWSGWLDSELLRDDGILLNGLLVSTTSSSNFLRFIDREELLRRPSGPGSLLKENEASSGLLPVGFMSDIASSQICSSVDSINGQCLFHCVLSIHVKIQHAHTVNGECANALVRHLLCSSLAPTTKSTAQQPPVL